MPSLVQSEPQPGESIFSPKMIPSLCSAVLLFIRNVCLALQMKINMFLIYILSSPMVPGSQLPTLLEFLER